MLFSPDFLTIDQLVRAVCWTLAHSLWQGLILALLAALILVATKKSSAALRYNVLVVFFSVFVTVIIYTFCSQWMAGSRSPASSELVTLSTVAAEDIGAGQTLTRSSVAETIRSFLNEHAFSVVCIWFLIFMIRGIRLIAGLRGLQQTKTKHLFPAGDYWTSRVSALAIEMGIHQAVRFFQSGITKVPAVLGHFKPVILFPVGLLTSLPPDEVEAILLHELAHIRRKDYMVNLLQNMVEICLFFNPGALWVSSLIKQERENCCDDIAVRKTGNKRNYINALLSFQEFNLGRQVYAPAIAGRKFQLLARVKRLINDNNKTMNAMEKFSLTAGLFVAGITALAFTTDLSRQKSKNSPSIDLLKNELVASRMITAADAALLTASDTIPNRPMEEFWNKESANYSSTIDGKRYRLVMKDGKITELYIDEEKVADEKIGDHKDITDRMLKEAKEKWEMDMKMAELARREMQQEKEQSDRERKRQSNDERRLDQLKKEQSKAMSREFEEAAKGSRGREIMAEKYRSMPEKDRIRQESIYEMNEKVRKLHSDYTRQQVTEEIELQEKNEVLRKLTSEQSKELSIVHQNIVTIETEKAMNEAIQLQNEAKIAQQAARDLQLKAELSAIKARQSQADDEKVLRGIIGDLLEEHVISDPKKLRFLLTDDELIVNGVKQPEEVHKKLKAKYLKEKDGSFNYNYNKKVQ